MAAIPTKTATKAAPVPALKKAAPVPVLKKVTAEKDLVQKEATEVEQFYTAAEIQEITLFDKAKARGGDALVVVQERAVQLRARSVTVVKDPQFQTVTISAAGGSLILGGAGGAFGLASGVVVGGAAGIVPALLTFGLSIPAGAALGGGAGLCTGTVVGAGTGAVGGATAGFGVYKYRVEIKDGLIRVRTKGTDAVTRTRQGAMDVVELTQVRIMSSARGAKTRAFDTYTAALEKAGVAVAGIKTKAGEKASKTCEIVATPEFKVTAASATGGAVVCGTAGGATGTVMGGAVGAAMGVIPALFTFGLSIPIGAVIGGGIGCATGTVAGGSVGALGGGTVGYKSFQHRQTIGEKGTEAWTKVRAAGSNAKTRVRDSLPAFASTGGSSA